MTQHVPATTRPAPAEPAVLHPAHAPRHAHAPQHARALTRALRHDIEAAHWAPTSLERRLCELLLTAAAGDGALTAPRVRAALAEGAMTFLFENDGRLAALLASLLPLLTEPAADAADPTAAAAVDDAYALLDRITRPAAPALARAEG
ncbi:hypothetical protein [Streptomyces sp. RerS4]|uniref:hypothetical protein n=1 Tax=Streptomyces sp. RerS4 TaxID=2942449 RepID=UPI00201BC569|nr:hypothetical protein [Streptomyces sp. RerS4]UQW99953.1 hypothetical protein M4D82_04925 [Streptomyces sp. RerS4]